MYVVKFVNLKGDLQEKYLSDFDSANRLAKSIREFSPKVSVKKLGEVSRRWDVYLFVPANDPVLVESKVKTNAARVSWMRWDHRVHHSALVFWPSELPVPINWFSSNS